LILNFEKPLKSVSCSLPKFKIFLMIKTKIYTENSMPGKEEKDEIVEFLYTHLEEYRDKKEDILKALNYALHIEESFGGFVLVARDEDNIVGSVVLNKTGMKGYIPENILVFIATHADHRGRGIGKMLMEKTIENAEGDIALHVEHENPARFLYQKYGFTNKYLEMRYKQTS
jgi:ribosomal-protein-alanine N-acetyltransferase